MYQKTKSPASEFLWIQKLTGSTRNLNTTNEDAQDTTDSVSTSFPIKISYVQFKINDNTSIRLENIFIARGFGKSSSSCDKT